MFYKVFVDNLNLEKIHGNLFSWRSEDKQTIFQNFGPNCLQLNSLNIKFP